MRLRRTDVSWQELDGEIIVLDLAGSVYLRVNGSGTVLWRALDKDADRDDLIDGLVSTYRLDRDQAGEDVDQFVAQLAAAGLLEDGS